MKHNFMQTINFVQHQQIEIFETQANLNSWSKKFLKPEFWKHVACSLKLATERKLMKDDRTLLATSIFYYIQGGQFTGSILMTSELRRNSNKSFSKK